MKHADTSSQPDSIITLIDLVTSSVAVTAQQHPNLRHCFAVDHSQSVGRDNIYLSLDHDTV